MIGSSVTDVCWKTDDITAQEFSLYSHGHLKTYSPEAALVKVQEDEEYSPHLHKVNLLINFSDNSIEFDCLMEY